MLSDSWSRIWNDGAAQYEFRVSITFRDRPSRVQARVRSVRSSQNGNGNQGPSIRPWTRIVGGESVYSEPETFSRLSKDLENTVFVTSKESWFPSSAGTLRRMGELFSFENLEGSAYGTE